VSPAWWPARAAISVAVTGTSLSTAGVFVFARPAPAPPSILAGPSLGAFGPHLATAVFPATAAVEGGQPERPCPFASGEALGSERLCFSPQFGPQPTHPVRQDIVWHREVCGDVGVTPAIYKSAVQQRAVIWGQISARRLHPTRLHHGRHGSRQ